MDNGAGNDLKSVSIHANEMKIGNSHLGLTIGCGRGWEQADGSGGANGAEDLIPNPREIHAAALEEQQR